MLSRPAPALAVRSPLRGAGAASVLCPVLLFTLGATLPARAEVVIRSSVDGGLWTAGASVSPRKGQTIRLKVEPRPGGEIRWYRIIPDLGRMYHNANFPWDPQPYRWTGFDRIGYEKEELAALRGFWEIAPFDGEGRIVSSLRRPPEVPESSWYYRDDVGSFWFQAEVLAGGRADRSPGIDAAGERGLPPEVFRVSIREGNGFLGWLSSFFNVPALFGSVPSQSFHYAGADCADVIMAAWSRWRGSPLDRDYNVGSVIDRFPRVTEFDLRRGKPDAEVAWGSTVRPGDLIAVRYAGARGYQHIGALYDDADGDGVLGPGDRVLHAGPLPLHFSFLGEGPFDGHVLVLRPGE